jgi:hypothetical protein
MESLVLDTNIVSYLMRGHRFAESYRPHLIGKRLAVSFILEPLSARAAYLFPQTGQACRRRGRSK